ncbi:hypothetical protein F5Y07DRAFT_384973 [Xylaria sp. FL0933]|nr:hypothetical protein F5Y07DRAFT_384973 [Xylaria sp. FL0933]
MSTQNPSSEKARSCCLKQRALVYDTTFDSCTIKRDKKIRENYEDYWPFQFGPPTTRADSWDLFLDEKADRATAVGSDPPPRTANYVAGLQLSRLGIWGRFLRKTGALNNGYIVRPQAPRQRRER